MWERNVQIVQQQDHDTHAVYKSNYYINVVSCVGRVEIEIEIYYALVIVSLTWLAYFLSRDYLSYKFTRFFIYFLFLSDEGPIFETLDHTIRIGCSTPTFLNYYICSCSVYNWTISYTIACYSGIICKSFERDTTLVYAYDWIDMTLWRILKNAMYTCVQ